MNVETSRPIKRTDQPSESSRSELHTNHWVCDFEAHEAMWQVQSILRLAGSALDEEGMQEVVQQAIFAAERLLVEQLRRAGWDGMGRPWDTSGRNDANDDEAAAMAPGHVSGEGEARGRQLAGAF